MGSSTKTFTTSSSRTQYRLNADARAWDPSIQAPEEDRSLFFTFSNGYPLTECQIVNFFTENYGPCVESVYIHWPMPRNNFPSYPLFGKIVFRESRIPVYILNGLNQTTFIVDGKPLRCKRFDATRSH